MIRKDMVYVDKTPQFFIHICDFYLGHVLSALAQIFFSPPWDAAAGSTGSFTEEHCHQVVWCVKDSSSRTSCLV